MLVGKEKNHFECNCVPHKEVCHQIRSFYCLDHDVEVGPTGYEWGQVPIRTHDHEYNDYGCWGFLCTIVKSMLEEPEIDRKSKKRSQESYDRWKINRYIEVKNMRRYLAQSDWKLLHLYADIAKIDYEVIRNVIIKYNS